MGGPGAVATARDPASPGERTDMPKGSYRPTCSVPGCDKPNLVHDMCGMHAQRVKTHGTTDDPYPIRECSEPGCEKRAKKRGMCDTHYRRWQRATRSERNGPRPPCSIPDCGRPIEYGVLCGMHYRRVLKWGDPLRVDKGGKRIDPVVRFWEAVEKDAPLPPERPDLGPCWLWTGTRDKEGYGKFVLDGRGYRAHRMAHEWLVGPIPEGLELDHLCRVTSCIKVVGDEHGPAHLEAVPHIVNALRGFGVGGINARKTHCIHGHEFTPENTYHPPGRPAHHRSCIACRKDAEIRAKQRRGGETLGIPQFKRDAPDA